MLVYKIIKINYDYWFQSPFSIKKKFLTKEKIVAGAHEYIINVKENVSFIKETSYEVNFEIAPIINSEHPFISTCKGENYDKYTHYAKIQTPFFTIYVALKMVTILPKKTQVLSINDLSRNIYFTHAGYTYRVMKIEDTKYLNVIKKSQLVLKKFNRTKTTYYKPIMLCFDIETVQYKDKLVPFIIVCKEVGEGGELFVWKKHILKFDIWIDEFKEGVELFCSWLFKFCLSVSKFYNCSRTSGVEDLNYAEVRLFGFNNNNFDNHLVFEVMRNTFNGFVYSYQSRYGKTTSFQFQKDNFVLSIVDLIKWFPASSLAKACKDYSIKSAKYDVDILKYCNESSNSQKILDMVDDMQPYFKSTLDEEFKALYKVGDSYNIYKLVVDYCIRDVDATIELYEKLDTNMQTVFDSFKELDISVPHRDIFAYISPPHLAFCILKDMLAQDKQKILCFNNEEQSEFIYKGYMGGRCQTSVYGEVAATPSKTGDKGEYIYADVTSEYPTAMKAYFPDVREESSILIGYDINVEHLQQILDCALEKRNQLFYNKTLHNSCVYLSDINKFKGFFECNIYPPNDERLLSTWAPIGTRIQTKTSVKLFFLNYAQKNLVLCTAHWNALILAGWKVEIVPNQYNIMFKEQSKLIKKYIEIVGKKKTESTDNKTLRNFYKLMLNSLYGKLAQKPKHILHMQKGVNRNNMYNLVYNEKVEHDDWSSSYHYLGAYVTAYSNFIVFQTAYYAELEHLYDYKPLNLRTNICIYTDTDSLILNKWKMSSFLKFDISEEIGEWNDDKEEFDAKWKYEEFGCPITRVIVLSKKSYYLLGEDSNELLCIKAKGIHSHIAKTITYDIIKEVACGKPRQFTFEGLAKQNININFDTCFKQDIIKSIHARELKKTLAIDHLPHFMIIESKDPVDLHVNSLNLNGENYTSTIKHYLRYTCSIRQPLFWLEEKKEKLLNLENIVNHVAMADSEYEDFDMDEPMEDQQSALQPIVSQQNNTQENNQNQEEPTRTQNVLNPNKKIEVNPDIIKDSGVYNSIIPANHWKGLREFYHMGLIGASNTGKTTMFKRLLADQKIPIADTYIVVAQPVNKSELTIGMASNDYLTEGDKFKSKKYLNFIPSEISKAFGYCKDMENAQESKLIFLNDCLITNSKTRDNIAFFINEAKNFKTTVVVEIHNLTGPNMLMLRGALEVKIYFGLTSLALSQQLELEKNDPIIQKYNTKSNRYDQILIYDKQHGFFNKDYIPF